MRYEDEWFEGGVDGVLSSERDDALTLFDDSQIVEETHTRMVLGWVVQSLTKRRDQSAREPVHRPATHRRPVVDIDPLDPDQPVWPPHRCRPRRVGWSLVIAAFAIVSLATVTIATGSTSVGIVACGGMAFSVCALVGAEIVSRY